MIFFHVAYYWQKAIRKLIYLNLAVVLRHLYQNYRLISYLQLSE